VKYYTVYILALSVRGSLPGKNSHKSFNRFQASSGQPSLPLVTFKSVPRFLSKLWNYGAGIKWLARNQESRNNQRKGTF